LELLVVLILIGLLTALVFPSMGRGMAMLRLKTSSREIAATLRLARAKAIAEQQIYWVGFDTEKNEIKLSSDNRQYRKSFELPRGIVISKISSPGRDESQDHPEAWFFFAPNGMAQAFEVLIKNNRGRGIRVLQNPLLRSPRLEEVASETSQVGVLQ
jgi:general secretion pathway protein H